MKHNSSYSIDQLLSEIQESWDQIKDGHKLDEMQKDMVLDHIKLLYTRFKSELPAVNAIIEEPIIENLPTIEIEHTSDEIENHSPELEAEKENTSTQLNEKSEDISIDNSEYHSSEDTNSEDTFLQNLNKIESKLIINQPLTSEEPTNLTSIEVDARESQLVSIDEDLNPNTTDPNTFDNLEDDKPEDVKIEGKAYSSNQILEYLKRDELPQRDIYDYLDINTRIGLVEHFFKGDVAEFNSCMFFLSKTETKDECQQIIDMYAANHGIDSSQDVYNMLVNLVERKLA